ncbi:predicted protein [Naegleria gruberi]|nr:uncharacterized protein NAEGRDRAFT_72864 [Naegleria gruberi]EFC39419.1 predicted protein [Naegleria gruberi]|eukprot:XP_002672163.1 predicted protein [Naegleria gruberi strain NEG-M]
MSNLVSAFKKFSSKNKTALEHVLSSVVSLCYASPEMCLEFSQSKGGLIILTNFLRDEISIASQKPSCFNMATSLLVKLTNMRENIEAFRESGFVKLIAEWFSKSPCPIPQPNLESYNAALFNMTKNAENQKILLSHAIVPQLIRFANGKDKQVSSFAAKSLWNLSATDMKCREDIRKEGINDATLKQLAGIQ